VSREYLVAVAVALVIAYVLASSTAMGADTLRIKVEVSGSFLFVEVYFCSGEHYFEVPALGSPLSLIRTYPEGVYATIDNRSVAVLVPQPPACVRINYVSEAVDLGKSLGFSYSGEVAEIRVTMNLSSVVPAALSPYPHDVSLNDTQTAVFEWYNVSRVYVEYVIVPRGVGVGEQTPRTGQATTTAVTATPTMKEETTTRGTETVPTSLPQTPRTGQASTPKGMLPEYGILYLAAAIGFLTILLAILIIRSRGGYT